MKNGVMKKTRKQLDKEKAYHEAGHAVIARALGVGITFVTMLSPDDTAAAGAQTHSATYLARDADQATQLAAIEKDIKICFAGPSAQTRHRPPKGSHIPSEWERDIENAQSLAARAALVKSGADLSQIDRGIGSAPTLNPHDAAEVTRLTKQFASETDALIAENWAAIIRVAEELLRRPILTEDDVDTLINTP